MRVPAAHSAIVRTAPALLLILAAAGCSRPPSADTFVASPLPSAFVALHSSNGQRQAFLERVGERWHGHLDDAFSSKAFAIVADADNGKLPGVVEPANPAEPPIDLAGWKPLPDLPVLIIESWAAGDPSLRASGPTSMVSMIRVAGDSQAIAAVNAALAATLEGDVGLVSPPGDALVDPGAVVANVATTAATRAITDEETGEVNPRARMAIFQIPVLLNRRFLAVEHFTFEDVSGEAEGAAYSHFTLHDLETGGSPDPDALIDPGTLTKLAALTSAQKLEGATTEAPVDWYPARPGIVLVYRLGAGGETGRRIVVPWRKVLPLLPPDSPLRAVAESVH